MSLLMVKEACKRAGSGARDIFRYLMKSVMTWIYFAAGS